MPNRQWIVLGSGLTRGPQATSKNIRKAKRHSIDRTKTYLISVHEPLQTSNAPLTSLPAPPATRMGKNRVWCREPGLHSRNKPIYKKSCSACTGLSWNYKSSPTAKEVEGAETYGVSSRADYCIHANLKSRTSARVGTRNFTHVATITSLSNTHSRSRFFSSMANDHTETLYQPPIQQAEEIIGSSGTEKTTDLNGKDCDGPVDEMSELIQVRADEKEDLPPLSSLKYKIPEDVYKEARSKRSEPVPTYLTYSLYLSPEGEHIPCHYVRKKDAAERVAKLFADETLLGFDLEWKAGGFGFKKNSIKDNVSLIQLASESRVAMFHISLHYGDKIEDLMPPTLKEILASPNIMKVGVSISADCTRLQRNLGVEVKGQFELSHLHNLVKYGQSNPKLVNRRLVNLAAQTEEHLGLPLAKGDVRQSDWTKELSMEQVIYAATDAYAAVHLFDVLNQKRLAMVPTPPLPAFAEKRQPIDLGALATVETSSSSDEDIVDFDEDEDSEDSTSSPATMELPIRTRSHPSLLSPKTTRSATDSSSKTYETPVSEEVDRANAWVAEYRSAATASTAPAIYPSLSSESEAPAQIAQTSPSTSSSAAQLRSTTLRATPAHLRSYYLWHHETLEVSTISSLLRAPPLQTTTVAGYILNAVQFDRLPYDRGRALAVLNIFPVTVRKGRYGRLLEECERNDRG